MKKILVPLYNRSSDVTGLTECQRFWQKVDAEGPCWEWTASLSGDYGQFFPTSNTKVYAHRYSWESLVGPIPKGMDIDHLCRNCKCVNPDHLETVSRATNTQRGWRNDYMRCPRGHRRQVKGICHRCHADRQKGYRAHA